MTVSYLTDAVASVEIGGTWHTINETICWSQSYQVSIFHIREDHLSSCCRHDIEEACLSLTARHWDLCQLWTGAVVEGKDARPVV